MASRSTCHDLASAKLPKPPQLRSLDVQLGLYDCRDRLAPTNTAHHRHTFIPRKMIPRLARVSGLSGQALGRSTRALPVSRRHKSTVPQTATAQPPQTQQVSTPQVAKHPSSVSHPALGDQEPRNTDNAIFLIFGGLLLAGAPLSYWYWGYRERAMKAKKEEMLRGIQERYAARHGSG